MKRLVAAAVLSLPGLAFAQAGGSITIGTGTGTVIGSGLDLTATIGNPGDFQLIYTDITSGPFPITNLGAIGVTLDAAPAFPQALIPDAMLNGDAPIITVEEEGVRMPDKQFSLPE